MEKRHFIQRHILGVLMDQEYARFRDMRPDNVDSNAYSYHLGVLQKEKLVQKTDKEYTLTVPGLAYVDLLNSEAGESRQQPKIMTIVVIENEHGQLLAHPKERQPFIGKLTFPCGKLHMEDISIKQAALREAREKTGVLLPDLRHIGDCYVAVTHEHRVAMNTLMHVFYTRVHTMSVTLLPHVGWYDRDEFAAGGPATKRVMQLLNEQFNAHRFFDEHSEAL